MKKNIYNKGGELNSFNNGGTHAQNPLGGIPQGIGANGKPNLVEEGETSADLDKGKYIFSNKVTVDLVSEFNLPSYIKDKSFSDASVLINNKFKDRNDPASSKTKESFLTRLSEAQEYIKMQSALKNNAQEVPDQMNGEIPEGMNEFKLGGLLDVASTGLGMINSLSGDNVSSDSTSAGISGALSGAQAGMAFGPLGAAAGGVLGGISSLKGSGKAKE